MNMKISMKGVSLIAEFEGFKGSPYLCPAGVATIGFGSTRYADGKAVSMQDNAISVGEAKQLLADTLGQYEAAVGKAVTAGITQNQFDAAVTLCYNIGAGAFSGSTLVKKLNAGDVNGAAEQFLVWNKGAGKVLPGLVRRREAERKLFAGEM